jgi:hypothetical protein
MTGRKKPERYVAPACLFDPSSGFLGLKPQANKAKPFQG